MRAGRLRHVITIQRATVARDSVGNVTTSWADLAARRAYVEPQHGAEFFAGSERHANMTVKIVMRYLSGLSTKDRIVFGGVNYDILSILDRNGRRADLEIMARTLLP
jgi:SPP1 family predicted phage head-tail adaptor